MRPAAPGCSQALQPAHLSSRDRSRATWHSHHGKRYDGDPSEAGIAGQSPAACRQGSVEQLRCGTGGLVQPAAEIFGNRSGAQSPRVTRR